MKTKFLISLLAACSLLSFCTREPDPVQASVLTVSWEDAATKGAATESEKQLHSLWFYVFDANGMLDTAHECTAADLSARKATIRVKTGGKTVYAVANLPETRRNAANAAATLEELEAVTFDLSDNGDSRLIMMAKGTVNVVATTGANCPLTLERPLVKITLGTVRNSLPAPFGAITVTQAFLCNVVGNQNIACNAAAATWYNQNGTDTANGGKTATIGQGGHSAQSASFTYREVNAAVNLNDSYGGGQVFYAMPNSITAEPGNPAYGSTFVPTCTVLMVVARIKGKDYYYPVPLKNTLVRNTDNVVNLTVIGLGNTLEDGPLNKIEKADLTATVTVSDWSMGSTYTETI